MKPIQVANDIVPIAAFKSRASEIVRSLRSRGRPMIITQNGRPAAVLLSPEDFDRLTYRERFVAAVEEGLEDARAGRVVTDAELERVLDAEFGKQSR
jgi:antitoxin YefM